MERNAGRQAAHAARLAAGEAARPDPIARPAADRTVTQAGRKARSPQPGRCPRMPATRSCLPPSEVGPGNRSGWHAHGVVVDRHVSAIGGVIVGEAGHLLTLCDTGGNGFLRACRARAVFLVKATSKSLSLSPRRPSFALLGRFLIPDPRLPRNRICKCRCLGLGMGFVSVVPTPRLAPGLARTLPKAPLPASRPACLTGRLPSSRDAAAPISKKFAAIAGASRAEPRKAWRRRGSSH